MEKLLLVVIMGLIIAWVSFLIWGGVQLIEILKGLAA